MIKALEEERMKYTLLAGNPELFDSLYNESDEDDFEWVTPSSQSDIDEIDRLLGEVHHGREVISVRD